MNPDLSAAMITDDGILTGISARAQKHPRFGTEAYEVRVAIPLAPPGREVAQQLLEGGGDIGRICIALRSTLAQLQCEAFGDPETELSLAGDHLDAVSLMTMLGGEHGPEVLHAIRRLASEQRLHVASAGLFPHAAKAGVIPLRLRPVEYAIDYDVLSHGRLEKILGGNGSGRRLLEAARREIRRSLGALDSRKFFLGQFDLDTVLDHHVVVEPSSRRNGEETGVIHGSARIFHAGREEPRCRQAEIWNSNGVPEPLSELEFVGTAYAPSLPTGGGRE